MTESWTLTIDQPIFEDLMGHLFPGDEDEHGAVLAAGIVTTDRGTRLLARELFKAAGGVDFVPGRRGYRMLTAEFVRDKIRYCRDERLAYLAIHNHGGRDYVQFSEPDNRGARWEHSCSRRTPSQATSGPPTAPAARSARP